MEVGNKKRYTYIYLILLQIQLRVCVRISLFFFLDLVLLPQFPSLDRSSRHFRSDHRKNQLSHTLTEWEKISPFLYIKTMI